MRCGPSIRSVRNHHEVTIVWSPSAPLPSRPLPCPGSKNGSSAHLTVSHLQKQPRGGTTVPVCHPAALFTPKSYPTILRLHGLPQLINLLLWAKPPVPPDMSMSVLPRSANYAHLSRVTKQTQPARRDRVVLFHWRSFVPSASADKVFTLSA